MVLVYTTQFPHPPSTFFCPQDDVAISKAVLSPSQSLQFAIQQTKAFKPLWHLSRYHGNKIIIKISQQMGEYTQVLATNITP